MTRSIPFNRPYVAPDALARIEQALHARHFSGDGPATKQCHEILSAAHNGAGALLTTSCTHALELAALLLDLVRDDEVIVPSFAFTSTVNAFVLRGARPVFADVRPDTLNLDEKRIEELVTERTRAICLIHYAGVAAEMEGIGRIAKAHDLEVVEDNAHGLFGKYRGAPLGTFGTVSALSFHETKNFSCGEGGAIIVNDRALFDRAEVLREKGTNRAAFFRGFVDKYTWVDVGSSYLPSELLAAFLLAQLERREEIQQRRRQIFERYQRELSSWASQNGVQLPCVPNGASPAYHLFYMIFPDLDSRTRAIQALRGRGVQAVFHYLPLHLSPMGQRFGQARGDCPVTERVSDGLLRLPFFNELTDAEQSQVIDAVTSVTV